MNTAVRVGSPERGLACVQHVDRAGHREHDLIERLGTGAAALVLEDQPVSLARNWAERVAARVDVPAYGVSAACLVPPAVLGDGIGARSAFVRRHARERAAWIDAHDEVPTLAPFDGALPFVPERLDEVDLDALVARLDIDHSLPPSRPFPAGRAAAADRLARLTSEILPGYATNRNDATLREGASGLSPYLHFGVLGPREVMRQVAAGQAGARHKAKFADELLGWREWFHYRARSLKAPERYDHVARWARDTLAEHADDPRPDAESLAAMVRGETRDESWNACQRQFLRFGWMRNNLRMYWAKRIIAMTPSPEIAWATACYLNDRLSLDGQDPSTYGNIAAMFGGMPADREGAVYGRVAMRGDGSMRSRDGGSDWLARAASQPTPMVTVPTDPPGDRYLAD